MATATQLIHSGSSGSQNGMFTELVGRTVAPDKPLIPTVCHVVTNDDLGVFQGEKLKPVDFNKVIKLLTDPHTCLFFERHILALGKLTRHYASGFLMRDLVQVSKLLNICADRIEMNDIYVEPLCTLLKICGLPFLKEKSSDELSYRQIATETISQLGYLLRVDVDEVRIEICKSLIQLYTTACYEQNLQNLQPCNVSYNQSLVEDSDVAETVVRSLSFAETSLKVRLSIIDVLQRISRQSVVCCTKMLQANAAYQLCSRLTDPDPSGELLFRAVEVVWNMQEMATKNEVVQQLSYQICISQIRDAFLTQLSRGYSHYDRQLRNDLVVLATLIADANFTAPFVETGFVKQLTLLATFQEVKSHNPLVKSLKLTKNHEDFELKKLILNILVILSGDPAALQVASEGHIMLALLTYVRCNESQTPKSAQEWTPAYFEEIQLQVLSALTTLGPKMIDDYVSNNGGTRALLLLEWCVGPEDFGGHGNSFHGGGGRGNKRAQMRHCLRFINAMVSTGEEVVIQDFVDQGAINMLNSILTSVSQSAMADDAIDVEMQCDMLFILSVLCENDVHRKELFGNEGVDNLVRYLALDQAKLNSGLGHHRLVLSAVDCVWCSVLGCYSVEDYFLEKEGVFLLLDLLEGLWTGEWYCPRSMFNQVLGCLLDLSENLKAVPHLSNWRGQGDKSAPHLLCDIWRQEEANLGVLRQENGAMSDLRYPMMGEEQRIKGPVAMPSTFPSRSIVDVSDNLRAKIYAIFGRIGYIDLPGISVDDHVTLTVIERYLDFKLGEVWSEIHLEMEEEQVRPISPDLEALEWIGRSMEEESVQVERTQAELFEAQAQQDQLEEMEHYMEIRENHKQKEKTLQDWADFVERTSKYAKLREAKDRQLVSIDASRIMNLYKEPMAFHSADISNIQTTVFSSQLVTIDSTPPEIFGGHLAATARFALPNARRGGSIGRHLSATANREAGRVVDLIG